MRANAFMAATLLSALLPAVNVHAYMVYPDRNDPRNLIFLIERATGDVVKFASLPPPFNVALQSAQGPDRFSFRWRYAPGQFGLAYLNVDSRGRGVLTVEFSSAKTAEGDSFGAAAVLVSKSGRPLHTFYARADIHGISSDDSTETSDFGWPSNACQTVARCRRHLLFLHEIREASATRRCREVARDAVGRRDFDQGRRLRAAAIVDAVAISPLRLAEPLGMPVDDVMYRLALQKKRLKYLRVRAECPFLWTLRRS